MTKNSDEKYFGITLNHALPIEVIKAYLAFWGVREIGNGNKTELSKF